MKGVPVKGDQERSFCKGCAKGKASHVRLQALNEIQATRRCGIVHSDVLGPVSIESLMGKRFMILFTDDMMWCSQVYFMKSKSEAVDKFKEYQVSVEGTSGELIGVLHTDRGGEYMSRELFTGSEDQVCHLHKSLYSLKQSPRCWYEQLSTQLECTGFKQSKADPCLFYKWESGQLTVISIYMILLADLLEEMIQLKHQLSVMFKMTDMCILSYCLEIGVRQGEATVFAQHCETVRVRRCTSGSDTSRCECNLGSR